jgi:hypothetical protein
MLKLTEYRSIVAIDPTSRGLAFAFFENGEFLDFGRHKAKPDEKDELALFDWIVDNCAADIVVLENPNASGSLRRGRVTNLLAALAQHARRRDLLVHQIAAREVREAWKRRGNLAKTSRAAALAELFPDLAAIVPPARRPWESETERVHIFDAVALALHAFGPPASSADDLAA